MSLSQRIRSDIETGILSGDWKPGDRIPFEHELMQRYSCARMTVSKALTLLQEAGLIERRRRAGSFVRRPATQQAVLSIPDIRAEIIGAGKHYTCEIVQRFKRRAQPDDLRRLGDGRVRDVLHLICLHRADALPHAYEDRLIVLDAVPDAEHEKFDIEPPGTWLLNHVPWQEAEHRIEAIAADAGVAQLLDVPPHAPCLAVERKTWSAGAILTSVRQIFPGDRQTLVARFTPSAGGGDRGDFASGQS
jgi:GntR family histidine utilization transcriptional repressor